MYELKQGTARIVCTLDQLREDPVTVNRLAQILHYVPEQLTQDLQALSDYYTRTKRCCHNEEENNHEV